MTPESTRATVSALLDFECINAHIVIDFLLDRYTSESVLCLIIADLIRLQENPVLLPSSR